MRVGIAADHGGYKLKANLADELRNAAFEVVDFGAGQYDPGDDYPDYVIPLAVAVAEGRIDRGIALCGSGIGASIVANKVPGVRAAVICDHFSARQGVEDDDMNVLCLGSRMAVHRLASELVTTFLAARFSGAERHVRRLAKVAALEKGEPHE